MLLVVVLHQKVGEHVLSTKLGRLARVAHRTVRWAGPDSPVSPDSPVARTRQSGVVESERKLAICAGSSGISTCRRVQTSPYIYEGAQPIEVIQSTYNQFNLLFCISKP